MHLDSFSATIIYYLNYLGINLNLTNPATVSIPINSGTVLGKMGDSGNTTGVHLHFQIQTASSLNSNNNSTLVNPVDVFETTVGFVGDIYWPENWY